MGFFSHLGIQLTSHFAGIYQGLETFKKKKHTIWGNALILLLSVKQEVL